MAVKLSNFLDLHAHLLPGLDDGPKNIDESISLALCYTQVGIKKVVTTPHYIPGTAWSGSKAKVLDKVVTLQEELDRRKIELQIIPGMEIAFHAKLPNRLQDNLLLTLGGSSHYLLEPSFHDSPDTLIPTVIDLVKDGYKFILAHPERIKAFQENPEPVLRLIHLGVKTQVNTGSLLGKFGRASKKMAKYLLANDGVNFLASDAHDTNNRIPLNETDWIQLHDTLSSESIMKLCVDNPGRLFSDV